jgi:hypothetical protein
MPLSILETEILHKTIQRGLFIVENAEEVNLTGQETPDTIALHIERVLEKLSYAQDTMELGQVNKFCFELGILWGEQVCRAYGWHWDKIESLTAIVSKDGLKYILPEQYIIHVVSENEEGLGSYEFFKTVDDRIFNANDAYIFTL